MLPEADAGSLNLQGLCWALDVPHPVSEVDVTPNRLVPQPVLQAHLEGLLEVVEALRVPEFTPGRSPELPGHHGYTADVEFLGKPEGLLGPL